MLQGVGGACYSGDEEGVWGGSVSGMPYCQCMSITRGRFYICVVCEVFVMLREQDREEVLIALIILQSV